MSVLAHLNCLLCESTSPKKIIYIKLCKMLLTCFSFEKYKELRLLENCVRYVKDRILEVRMWLVDYLQEARRYFAETQGVLDGMLEEPRLREFMGRRVVEET